VADFGKPIGKFGDPAFQNPANKVVNWTNRLGVINQKVVEGPDAGLHRGYDPSRGREFEAGPKYDRKGPLGK
jgi:hypothetical protein